MKDDVNTPIYLEGSSGPIFMRSMPLHPNPSMALLEDVALAVPADLDLDADVHVSGEGGGSTHATGGSGPRCGCACEGGG